MTLRYWYMLPVAVLIGTMATGSGVEAAVLRQHGNRKGTPCLITAEGPEIWYTVCSRTEGRLVAALTLVEALL